METTALNPTRQSGYTVALGFFDSIHIGHRALIASASAVAARLGTACAVFTFRNGIYTKDGAARGLIYPYGERLQILRSLGVHAVIAEDFTPVLCATSPQDFLDGLYGAISVKAIVCGADYTYGAGKAGNVETLREDCRRRGVPLTVEEDFCLYGSKVSTSRIKRALTDGDIESANALLGAPFTLTGEVVHGRAEGRKHGFPTCNQSLPADKFLPRNGVYGSIVTIDGAHIRAVTNVGARPTFGLDTEICAETHLFGYRGDLYGTCLSVELHRYLRDVRRFETPAALYAQLETDKQWK